jgi:23S rRNA (cytosine1962-C5)-methyltransferase
MDAAEHRLERADVLTWLPEAAVRRERYDLIVCDPPTFSNSKKMRRFLDVEQMHPELINGCLQLLSPEGVLYFSTNHRGFELKEEALAPCERREISEETVPVDYRNRRIHRCWRITPAADTRA